MCDRVGVNKKQRIDNVFAKIKAYSGLPTCTESNQLYHYDKCDIRPGLTSYTIN